MPESPKTTIRNSLALLRWAGGRFHHAAAFHRAARILASVFVLGVAVGAWLWIAGVPSRVTRLIFQHLETDKFSISVERVWLDPLEGLKAQGLRIVPLDRERNGPIGAEEVLLDINWLNFLAGGPKLDAATLRGGTATLRLPPEFGTNGLPRDFVISNLNARVVNTWDMFRLERFTAQWPAGTLEGEGVAVAGEAEDPRDRKRRDTLFDTLVKIQMSVQDAPAWARELYQHLSAIQTVEPVRLAFAFHRHAGAPELSDVRLRAEGGSAVSRGLQLDGFRVEAEAARGVLRIPLIDVKAAGRACRLDGAFVMTNRMIELHAVNELPPAWWRELLPSAWLADLSHTPLQFRGALQSEIWMPPATLADFGLRWRGVMSWEDAEYRRISFRGGRMEIIRNGPAFAVSNFTATASRGEKSGPLACSVNVDLPSGASSGHIEARLDPHVFDPWFPPGTRGFLTRLQFPAAPPAVIGQFSAGGESNRLLVISGTVRGEGLLYRGVGLTALDTALVYSNEFITLDPFTLARTNGTAAGRLALDLKNEVYAFDLRSTTDPSSIGQLVSSNLHRAINAGHYGGPAVLRAAGTYDERRPANTDIRVDVVADRIGLKWFTADHATFTLGNRGLHYEATNIEAKAFGGQVVGRFFHYPGQEGGGHRFELDLDTRDSDLRQVILAMHPDSKDPATGTMNLKLQLAGLVDDARLDSYKGEGRVDIREGQLHKMKLFGALSTLLARLSPDLGHAAQTGLHMSFDIRDGKLTTANALLEGTWISVKAKGTYALDGGALDFLAEVQLLKKGTVVGEAVRLLTSPVTKLFQIRLTGTLDDPQWETANLPKIF